MGRLGKRGAFLLIMGGSEIARGYGLIVDPVIRKPNVEVLHDMIPPPWYGVAWIICGVIGMLFAFAHRHGRDRFGFAFQVLPPAFTALSYIGSWFRWLIWSEGDPRGWVNSILFITIAALVILMAGVVEPKARLPIHALQIEGERRGRD